MTGFPKVMEKSKDYTSMNGISEGFPYVGAGMNVVISLTRQNPGLGQMWQNAV